jgi:phage-related minor tail protein
MKKKKLKKEIKNINKLCDTLFSEKQTFQIKYLEERERTRGLIESNAMLVDKRIEAEKVSEELRTRIKEMMLKNNDLVFENNELKSKLLTHGIISEANEEINERNKVPAMPKSNLY